MKTQLEEDKLVLRQPRWVLAVGVLGAALFGVITLVSVVSSIVEGQGLSAVFCGICFGIFVLLNLALVLTYKNQKLEVMGSTCTYTSVWGHKKVFTFQEIAKVVLRLKGRELVYRLVDIEGNKLVQLESWVQGLEAFLDLLLNHNIPFEELLGPQASLGSEACDWDPDHWEYRHRRHIQRGLWALRLLAIALAVLAAYLLFHAQVRVAALILALLPVLFYAAYAAFPHLLVWDRQPYAASPEWRQAHLGFPIAFLLLLGLLSLFFISLVVEIEFVSPWQAVVFGLVLFGLFFAVLFWRTPAARRGVGTVLTLLMLGTFFAFPATFLLNFALSPAPQNHVQAVVTGASPYEDRGSTKYHVRVYYGGKPYQFSTAPKVYHMAQNGEPLVICVRKSLFGVEYIMLHAA